MFILLLFSCKKATVINIHDKEIVIDTFSINNVLVSNNGSVDNIDFKKVSVKIRFNKKVDTSTFDKSKLYFTGGIDTSYSYKFSSNSTQLTVIPRNQINAITDYRMIFDVGHNLGGIFFTVFSFSFTTSLDSIPKFPVISDDSLLTLVQKQTFRYFWDYAHPVSGLARERLGSGETVTSGGSGFGLMSILVGIKRNFITRQQGFDRLKKITDFLNNPATDKFHGAFPHWLNGTTGKVIPFSPMDNGGDYCRDCIPDGGIAYR